MGKTVIYQILPRLWGNEKTHGKIPGGSLRQNGCGKFSSIDTRFLEYLRDDLHVTHVWFTGVIRHATTETFEGCPASNPQVVKGKAGSPYAITDYFDVNPYLADNPSERVVEFESLLKRTHDAGLKVLIDFVPNHVSRDYGKAGRSTGTVKWLGDNDDPTIHWSPGNDFYYYPGQSLTLPCPVPQGGSPYYENPAKASGNCFSPTPGINDWYETIRLNYCDFHTGTWDKMLDAVRYWCSKGVDGFRCDMVEMVPWQFMQWLIARIKSEYPGTVFVAEVYGKDSYRHYIQTVGFDYLYDKSGLYDCLRSVTEGSGTARGLTWNWQMLGDLQPRMLNFLENHDEQRFASGFFAGDPSKAAAPLCASLLFNTSAFMIYNGGEIGEMGMEAEGFSGRDGRTTIFDWWSVDSLRRLREYIDTGRGLTESESRTLDVYRKALQTASLPEVSEGSTFDLNYCNLSSEGFDPDKHFAFLRCIEGRALLFVCNFSGEACRMRIVIPPEAFGFMGRNEKETPGRDVSIDAFSYTVLPV